MYQYTYINIYVYMYIQPEEVVQAIKIAKAFDVPLSTRGGGHGYTCQGAKSGIYMDVYMYMRTYISIYI
jgi:FAD/FMN-containing dehydrogenase